MSYKWGKTSQQFDRYGLEQSVSKCSLVSLNSQKCIKDKMNKY